MKTTRFPASLFPSAITIDYLKPSGAIGFYHPDWVVVQQTDQGERNWIIETKGRVWEGTEDKDAAMRDWCARVSEQTGVAWSYIRVDQSGFDAQRPTTLAEVTRRGGEAEASFLL